VLFWGRVAWSGEFGGSYAGEFDAAVTAWEELVSNGWIMKIIERTFQGSSALLDVEVSQAATGGLDDAGVERLGVVRLTTALQSN